MPLTARQYFTLRRLHSLTGVVPVGVFLAEHFFTNSFALQGAQSYNDKVAFLKSIPYLYLVELFGIAVPILFHAALGVWIFWEAKMNTTRLPYKQNAMFTLQRITGVFLIFYIGYHVAVTRFGHWFGYQNTDLFGLMKQHLQQPLVAVFYVLGVVAASFHLGNGLWGFALHWGLVTERKAQRRWAWAAIGISVALALAGLNSLLAFEPFGLRPIRVFSEPAQEQTAQHRPGAPGLGLPAVTEGTPR